MKNERPNFGSFVCEYDPQAPRLTFANQSNEFTETKKS